MNFPPLASVRTSSPSASFIARLLFFIRRKKVQSDERASFLGRRSGGDLAL